VLVPTACHHSASTLHLRQSEIFACQNNLRTATQTRVKCLFLVLVQYNVRHSSIHIVKIRPRGYVLISEFVMKQDLMIDLKRRPSFPASQEHKCRNIITILSSNILDQEGETSSQVKPRHYLRPPSPPRVELRHQSLPLRRQQHFPSLGPESRRSTQYRDASMLPSTSFCTTNKRPNPRYAKIQTL
jgi:hypothetical protein